MSNEIAKSEPQATVKRAPKASTRIGRKEAIIPLSAAGLMYAAQAGLWWLHSLLENTMLEFLSAAPSPWVLVVGGFASAMISWKKNRDTEAQIKEMEQSSQAALDWWTAARSIRLTLIQPQAPHHVGQGGFVSFPVVVTNLSPKLWSVENLRLGIVMVEGTTLLPAIAPVRVTPAIQGEDHGAPVVFMVSLIIPAQQRMKPYTGVTLMAVSFDAYDEHRNLTPVDIANTNFHILVRPE